MRMKFGLAAGIGFATRLVGKGSRLSETPEMAIPPPMTVPTSISPNILRINICRHLQMMTIWQGQMKNA